MKVISYLAAATGASGDLCAEKHCDKNGAFEVASMSR